MHSEILLTHCSDPPRLERLYRDDPAGFARALSVALDHDAENPVLQVWAARLAEPLAEMPPAVDAPGALSAERARALLWATAGLVVTAGTWAKVPTMLRWTGEAAGYDYTRATEFFQRFGPFYVVGPLVALFVLRYRPPARLLAGIGAAVAALLAVQALRPISTDAGHLSAMHAPFLLLSLAGFAALGQRWQTAEARTDYLQLIGEAVALAGLLLLGGGALVALTMALFEAIDVDSSDVLMGWVVVYGAVGVLTAGAFLASLRAGAARVAPLLARVFGPLALAVLAVYLPALLLSGGLADRDSLLALNVALVAVLGLVVLIEAERPDVERHWTDIVTALLVAIALAADVAAFASIVGRLAGGGLTPNRLAVVGMNVLVAAHFAGLAGPLARRSLGMDHADGSVWTARFLSVYAAWSLVVVVAFPLIFGG